MNPSIDFTRGGYKGDVVEETFKPFSASYMPFWWYFREVLRACDRASPHWKKSDGTDLSDDEQRELVALSLLNYAVYMGIAEAVASFEQMKGQLSRTMLPGWRLFEVRRLWKAMYSSLYTSFNALCNIICVVVGQKPPVKKKRGRAWNYTPTDALKLVNDRGIKELAEPLGRCKDGLEIRDHLDHYWTIWHNIIQGQFLLDENFKKGYVPLHPKTEVSLHLDAQKLAHKHIVESAKDFNLIYRELSVEDGFLDQYLSAKGWRIDYSDYPPHNGQRPRISEGFDIDISQIGFEAAQRPPITPLTTSESFPATGSGGSCHAFEDTLDLFSDLNFTAGSASMDGFPYDVNDV
jgi:hypothetical protein